MPGSTFVVRAYFHSGSPLTFCVPRKAGRFLKVERHAPRDALESRAGNSRSGEVPLVHGDTVSDGAKIIVSIGVIGLPGVDKVR